MADICLQAQSVLSVPSAIRQDCAFPRLSGTDQLCFLSVFLAVVTFKQGLLSVSQDYMPLYDHIGSL